MFSPISTQFSLLFLISLMAVAICEKENFEVRESRGQVRGMLDKNNNAGEVKRSGKKIYKKITTTVTEEEEPDQESAAQNATSSDAPMLASTPVMPLNNQSAVVNDSVHTVPEWDRERAPAVCGDAQWHLYDGFCYKMLTGEFSWDEALAECHNQSANASLASIHSRQENEFVASLSTKFDKNFDKFCDGFWIGMTRKPNDPASEIYTCEWVDGTPVVYGNVPKRTEFHMPPWRGGQPDDSDHAEHCVHSYPKLGCDSNPQIFYGEWNDFRCSAKLNGAVCKKRRPIPI